MKKSIVFISVVAVGVVAASGQGTVYFNTSAAQNTRVSVTSLQDPRSLILAPATSTFYYALFASTTSSSVLGSTSALIGTDYPAISYVFFDANWTFVTYGESTGVAGRFAPVGPVNPDGSVTVPLATAGLAVNLVAVGWSANLGSTYPTVEAYLAGDAGFVEGWVGESAVATIDAGSLSAAGGIPAQNMFGSGPGQVGGLILGDQMPEPTTMALGILGAVFYFQARILYRKKSEG